MAPSTSPTFLRPPEDAADFGVAALSRFYAWQAGIYDWTRPLFLFGRREAVRRLRVERGHRVLDVGCGTGWNLGALAGPDADVVGVECSPAMLRRAAARVGALGRVRLDPRPYGSHSDYAGRVDRILFSYSLSMIPPYDHVLERARFDLTPGGRIAVVDFLDARGPVGGWLTRSHVALGHQRLHALERLFPDHQVEVAWTPFWRFFFFVGAAPAR
jgi:S-adenosylmethionine-diacylgycerolhomoserine-N-methlytransferase